MGERDAAEPQSLLMKDLNDTVLDSVSIDRSFLCLSVMVQIEDRTHASHVNNRIGFLTVKEPGSSNSRKTCLRMGARPVLVSLGHNRAAPGGSEGSEVTTGSGCGSGNVLLLLLHGVMLMGTGGNRSLFFLRH